MTEFIRREFHVEDADKTATHGPGAPRPAMPQGGVLYIIGLEGSGKSAVAAHLAKALGGTAHALPLEGADAALEAILAKGDAAVIEVPHKLLAAEGFRARMAASGRVLYLMAGAEAWARARGFRVLTLDVFAANARARAFYARLGYLEQTLKLAKPLT